LTAGEQDAASAAKNASFFDANERYARRIAALETYRHIRSAINGEIAGARRLLDVGNGGVFDYDTALAEQVVAVDLFLDEFPSADDGHISLRRGDALALAEPDGAYDVVLESAVLHHLVGADVDSTVANIRQAIDEAHRVLEPGGRLVVMESCVSPMFYALERRLFWALRLLARTPVMRHPATLQLPPEMIAELIGARFGEVAVTPIPLGRWIMQFGRRWPSVLTPARPYLFAAIRA
jgi:SAM-dependent methyltransferase